MGEVQRTTKDGRLQAWGRPQTLLMGDAARTLIYDDEGPALAAAAAASGYQEVLLNSNFLRVDAESAATEELVLPPEASSAGVLLFAENTGGESVLLYSSTRASGAGGTLLGTLAPGGFALLQCDGQTWQVYINRDDLESSALQVVSAAGAVAPTAQRVAIVTGAGAMALTLANGVEGHRMTLIMRTDGGGDATLTPTNLENGTAIVFSVVGQVIELIFTDGEWFALGGDAYVTAKLTDTQVLIVAGPVDLVHRTTIVESAGAIALTLADGVQGQLKYIVMSVDGGDATLTPTNLLGANNTITFNDVGDAVLLEFIVATASGWAVVANQGCTLA